MNVSAPFIEHPVGTSLLAAGLAILGIVAYHLLPVASLPAIDFPMILVTASLPGADPVTAAASLAAPLEKRLSQISGVSEITSSSTLDGASVTIQFDLDRSVDAAARDVQAAINAAANDLPPDLPNPPTYRKVNPADAPILVLALTSKLRPPAEVFEAADEVLGQRLSQVDGVSQVVINGAEKSAVRVQVNPEVLASTGLSLEDIRSFLASVNVNAPNGIVESGELSQAITSNDQLVRPEQYERLVIRQVNGLAMPLNTLGSAVEGVENNRLAGWAGTERAVLVIVFKQPGANVIETVNRIREVIPQIERWIPPAIKISLLSDRTTTIRASFMDLEWTLALTVGLVILVIWLFLRRMWPTIIASLTVPLTLAGTFGAMYLCGFSFDNLSLMAITISVGFVVDDAIVVIENVFRRVEAGEGGRQAAFEGASQIGFTVISMSTSLVAVFIPLLFMGGLIGRLFHEFAVTLCIAILISGVVSLTLTPMLCSRWLKREADYPPPNALMRTVERGLAWLTGRYETSLRWVLRHQPAMWVVTLATLLATVWLYVTEPKGFFPQQDTGLMMGVTEASQDVSFDRMARLQARVARIVMADPAVATVGSFIGAAVGSSTVNNGRMFITLKPRNKRDAGAEEVLARIRRKLAGLEGITLYLQTVQDIRVGGRLTKAQYQYALQTTDLDELNTWSTRLVERLRELPQLKDVSSDLQTRGLQSNVAIDRDAAARLGLSASAIDNTLYDAFGQRQVSIIYKRYNQHHVILEADPRWQLSPSSLDRIYVRANNGRQVPLSSAAGFSRGNTYLSVNHQGQFPASTISFNLARGVALGDATELIRKITRELKLPQRVQGSFQGTAQVFQASLATTPILLFAALVTVYIVLGVLYESLVHPLTILSTLPSAGVGALIALQLLHYDLSLVSFIGIILLMGIVKKNAIMMIDFALEAQRQQQLPPEQAIGQACLIRFRPIMMTTMAALLGSMPLAIGFGIGGELRRPLGIAVVGGLIFSQALTLFTTPVIYLAFERLRRTFRRRD